MLFFILKIENYKGKSTYTKLLKKTKSGKLESGFLMLFFILKIENEKGKLDQIFLTIVFEHHYKNV